VHPVIQVVEVVPVLFPFGEVPVGEVHVGHLLLVVQAVGARGTTGVLAALLHFVLGDLFPVEEGGAHALSGPGAHDLREKRREEKRREEKRREEKRREKKLLNY